jgi:4-amino-4-deoxy-L-arabinose transferase-like glycosyltransferase
VIACYGAPIFFDLGALDMENDEASYSYQVDRILENGNWLTPRTVPRDEDFVEKPPLMFWIVAGGIKLGLLPHTDFGMRLPAAVCGALAFVYIYLLGWRLSGAVAGVASGLILFTYEPLLFDHGLRTNNMEGALFLSYCGGMYHFVRWTEGAGGAWRRWHAAAAMAFFVLGFMTKFVAAAFLPLVWILAVAAHPDRRAIATRWKDWLAPIGGAVLFTAPWFVFQTARLGKEFWQILVGQHIYERFTTGLDPGHLKPWHFYFSSIWEVLGDAGSRWIVVAGSVFVSVRALWTRDWRARLLVVWAAPLLLISIGSSKLLYYADPFVPPLALAAGWLVGAVWHRVSVWGAAGPGSPQALRPSALTTALAVAAIVAMGVGVWTWGHGAITLNLFGLRLLRNHSVVRPLVLGAVLTLLSGRVKAVALWVVSALVLVAVLPLSVYSVRLEETRRTDHPIRALRDCLLDQQARGASVRHGTYTGGPLNRHTYFLYLRQFGGFVFGDDGQDEKIAPRLFTPGEQSLVILTEPDYRRWENRARSMNAADGRPPAIPPAVRTDASYVVVLPADYGPCLGPTIEAGGARIDWLMPR